MTWVIPTDKDLEEIRNTLRSHPGVSKVGLSVSVNVVVEIEDEERRFEIYEIEREIAPKFLTDFRVTLKDRS